MHAIQPPRHSTRPVRPRPTRQISADRQSRQQAQHAAIAAEVGVKLAVNLILASVAGTALVRLLPQTFSQHAKLNELQAEVAWVEGRVDRLQTEFNQNFDPQQTQAVMKEQSNRVDPRQRQVIWLQPASPQP